MRKNTWTSRFYTPPMTAEQHAEALMNGLDQSGGSDIDTQNFLLALFEHIDTLMSDQQFTDRARDLFIELS